MDFSQVIQKHAALLGRVAATYEANFHLRQELLQEISLAVWQALEKFKGDSSVKPTYYGSLIIKRLRMLPITPDSLVTTLIVK
jgi:DNA-directed RNA polymerase specialized sigma24 family protein